MGVSVPRAEWEKFVPNGDFPEGADMLLAISPESLVEWFGICELELTPYFDKTILLPHLEYAGRGLEFVVGYREVIPTRHVVEFQTRDKHRKFVDVNHPEANGNLGIPEDILGRLYSIVDVVLIFLGDEEPDELDDDTE
jgi:hypothetical protein